MLLRNRARRGNIAEHPLGKVAFSEFYFAKVRGNALLFLVDFLECESDEGEKTFGRCFTGTEF